MRHTVFFADPARDHASGRFASPYRTWRALRDQASLAQAGQGCQA